MLRLVYVVLEIMVVMYLILTSIRHSVSLTEEVDPGWDPLECENNTLVIETPIAIHCMWIKYKSFLLARLEDV